MSRTPTKAAAAATSPRTTKEPTARSSSTMRTPPRNKTPSRHPPRTPTTRTKVPYKEAVPMKKEEAPLKNAPGEEGIQVAIRLRPMNTREEKGNSVWKALAKYNSVAQTTIDGKPMPEPITGRNFFSFDKAFDGGASTLDVYQGIAKDIVKSTISGLNGTIFAYGQTSSGKTHTMQGSGSIAEGSVAEKGGLVHLAVADIFQHIRNTPERRFLVRASFLEIYNEELRDLLSNDSKNLPIREDPRRGVFVDAKEEYVTDFDSLLSLLAKGEKSRQFAATAMNERSSRSHTIFRISIESHEPVAADISREANDDGEEEDEIESCKGPVRVSTLNLVDLAGSESVRFTGATGKRQKEGGMINQSLLALSQVISALGDQNQSHVNFRDSKLTRILQPSLSGNARLSVVCCATPSDLYLEETRSTLMFASRAKLVKTQAKVNEVMDDRSLIKQLRKELADARRYGSIPDGSVVRELEEKAAMSGTAAKMKEETIIRLKQSILNGKMSWKGGPMTPVSSDQQRKRRISACDAHLSTRSTDVQVTCKSPRTLPRMKRKKVDRHPQLHLKDELDLLRSALSVKSTSLLDLELQLAEVNSMLSRRDAEVLDLRSANDGLQAEMTKVEVKATRLSEKNDTLNQTILEQTIFHQSSLAAKQAEINELELKMQKDSSAKSLLNDAIADLESKLKSTATMLRTKEAEMDDAQRSINQLVLEKEGTEAERGRLSELNDLLNQSLREHVESHEAYATKKEAETVALSLQITEQASANSLLNDTVCELKQRSQTLVAQVANLTSANQADVARLELDNKQLLQNIADHQERELLHAAEKESLEDRILAMKEFAQQLSNEKDSIATEVESLRTTKVQLENSNRDALQEMENVTSAYDSVSHRLQWSKVLLQLLQQSVSSLESSNEISQKLLEDQESAHMHQAHADSSEIDRLQSTLSVIQSVVDEKDALLRSANEMLRDKDTQIGVQSSSITDLQVSITASQDKNRSLRERLELVQENAEQAMRDWTHIKDEFDATIMQLRADKIEHANLMDSKLSLVHHEHAEALQRLQASEEGITAANTRIVTLTSEYDALRASSEASTREQESAFERATATIADLTAQLDQTMKSLSKRASEVSEARQQLEITHTTLEGRNVDLAASQGRAASLASEVERLTSEMQEMVDTGCRLRDDLKQSTDQLEIVQQKLSSLEHERDDLISINLSLRTSVATLEARSEEDSTTIEELSFSARELREENSLLETRLQQVGNELDTINNDLQELQYEHGMLVRKSADLELESSQRQNSLLVSQTLVKKLTDDINGKDEELTDALNQILDLEEAEKENKALLSERADDLIKTHEILEISNEQLSSARQRVSDLEDELASKTTMLSDEISSLTALEKINEDRIANLEVTIESLTAQVNEAEQLEHQLHEIKSNVKSLEAENIDLKSLLISANSSLQTVKQQLTTKEYELRNALHLIQEQEDENRNRKATFQPQTQVPDHSTDLFQANSAIESLRDELRQERTQRADTEAILTTEAEKKIEQLIARILVLEKEHTRLEAEGYAARKLVDEASDREAYLRLQVKELQSVDKDDVEKCIQLNSTISALRNENERLKNTDAIRQSSDTAYQRQLTKLKDELQSGLRRLKERDNEIDQLRQTNSLAAERLATLKKIEPEYHELQAEVKQLKSKLNAVLEESRLNNANIADAASLRVEVSQLKQSITEKDDRIAYLNKHKVTQELVDKMMKQKQDFKESKVRVKELEAELFSAQQEASSLRQQLSNAAPQGGQHDRLSKLVFDRNAMETRVRKLAVEKQKLENEQVKIQEVLRRFGYDALQVGEVSKGIACLCDRLVSFEKAPDNSSATLAAANLAKQKIAALECHKANLESRLDQLTQSDSDNKRTIAILRADLDQKDSSSCQALRNIKQQVADQGQHILKLQRENLSLYDDIKVLKNKLKAAKAELHHLKNDVDLMDMEKEIAVCKDKYRLPPLAPPSLSYKHVKEEFADSATPNKRRQQETPVDKENGSANNAFSLDNLSAKKPFQPSRSPGPHKSPFGQTHGLGGSYH